MQPAQHRTKVDNGDSADAASQQPGLHPRGDQALQEDVHAYSGLASSVCTRGNKLRRQILAQQLCNRSSGLGRRDSSYSGCALEDQPKQ